ncbi:MAG TPA: translocation/assembly module TamB domain-containing protein [Vicinamibacterales bacterium]|nr:translocation/assembly module TamB domain-containing protein [Vicinamibacterales bacterium]
MLKTTYRRLRAIVIVLAIIVAVVAVSTLAVDLGPALKGRAEREGSKWLDRPMHIGRLGVQLVRGRFVIEDLRVDGLTPESRPWLVAKRIEVSLTWRALFGREVLLDTIEMTDWKLVVESFPNGRHNWPRVNGPPRAARRPGPVVTTVQYLRATRGELVFDDYGSKWGIIAPNLEVTAGKVSGYGGRAEFHGGTIDFEAFEPMSADMVASFKVRDGNIIFDRIDLTTDGAQSELTGVVEAARWPEMTYQIKSHIQFPRMREIFFAKDTFALHGEGDFTGTFHLFKGGRELKGNFTSAEAGINDYRFANLEGSVVWVPDRFEVTRATSEFAGGQTRFTHLMAPLGKPGQRAQATFEVDYDDVDLNILSEFYELKGIRLAGRASGHNRLEWPLGSGGFRERSGAGSIYVTPTGTVPMGRDVTEAQIAAAEARVDEMGPFSNHTPVAPVAISGALDYSFDRDDVRITSGEIATAETFITFNGATTFRGDTAHIPFHVTSANWQESGRFLAGLMTAFGSPTRATEMDGAGQFDGVLVGAFRRPRIDGHFRTRAMRAFDVVWGDAEGDVVIENSYANVSKVVITRGKARIDASGLFSLGFPRRDRGEEINARIRIENRPVSDLADAFDLEDYPIEGLLSGEFHVYGPYTRPFGFGRMTITNLTAYDERFESASAGLRFEGNGVRLDALEIVKGTGGITGAAYVGWNGTYSFNTDGRNIAVESLDLATFPDTPALTGMIDFSATGSGTFEQPRYEVTVAANDLFFGDEGVGEATARLAIRDTLLTFELEGASPRLALSGTGRVELDDYGDAELSFRVNDTSLDSFARVFKPDLSPYTTAVASGTIRVVGELYNPEALRISTSVEQLDLRLVDYQLRNQGPIELAADGNTLRIDSLRLVGDDTALDVVGTVDMNTQRLSLQANGAANLAVLQGFMADLRSSGRADVSALIGGTAERPVVSGQAMLTAGRLRHFSFPHALEDLTGVVTFNASGIRLDDPGYTTPLTGKIGGGTVRFGGRVGFVGYALSEFDVTATGENMRLRFPEGMRSVVDATLALQGPATAPILSGTVVVDSASWTRGFGTSGNMFGGGEETPLPGAPGAMAAATLPLRYDVRITAPSTLHIENDQARIVASADVNLRGTFDRPLLFGRADIERGEVRFEGRRYLVTRGSLDFTNPNRIQPFFDIEAETRVRVPGDIAQTYRVTLRMAGTTERMRPEFTSDPPLAPLDILTILFSDTAPAGDIELASLRQPNQREQDILQARATRALTGALSQEVGRVVQETFGVDSFQITPLLMDPYQQSSRLNVNPAARVTIGKRISERLYLTYARSLSSATRDEIILLEYDQNDSLGWVLSQNEDRTYAIEVRKRHLF